MRIVGRILILCGIVLAGFFSKYGWLPQPEGVWKRYSVTAIQRISTPRHGKVERAYHLMVDGGPAIAVAGDVGFNAKLLQEQPKPTEIEVLSDHEVNDGTIRADGIHLTDGQAVLDPEQVAASRRPYEFAGVVICSALVIVGVLLHFTKLAKKVLPTWRGANDQ